MDFGNSVIQTTDNGFAITGSKMLIIENQNTSYNITKMYLIKTDAAGKELWNKTYGEGFASGTSLAQTRDDGYAIIGSFNTNSAVLVKTDAEGKEAWNTSFEITNGYTIAKDITQSDDGGYVITGGTGRTISEFRVFVVKFDANGKMAWNKTYIPGSGLSIIRTVDNGYAIMDGSGIIKIDANGNLAWNKTYTFNQATENDIANGNFSSFMITMGKSIVQTADGGYMISGTAGTYLNGIANTVSGNSSSKIAITLNFTYFMIKADSNGNEAWRHTYCGPGNFDAISAVQSDDDYVLIGNANDNATIDGTSLDDLSKFLTNRIIFVKADANGAEAWKNDIWSGTGHGVAMTKTNDGGLAIVGISTENTIEDSDIFLAKVNEYAK